jgi:hypothetical protein
MSDDAAECTWYFAGYAVDAPLREDGTLARLTTSQSHALYSILWLAGVLHERAHLFADETDVVLPWDYPVQIRPSTQ